MTKAVSGGTGVAEVGTGLGALPLLGKEAAHTPSAHHPLIPREQVLHVSWLPAPLHFLLHLTEAPSQRPGLALGEKLGGGGGEDGDKHVHSPLLSPPSSLACTCQGLPEFPPLGSEPRSQDSEPNSISVWLAWERLGLLFSKTVCGGRGLD